MGRKRKIPKESKTLKYLYFIKVNFHGKDVLKFGISNNYIRRFTEYNNSQTVGYIKEVLHIFKSNYPKRIESMLKWYMTSITKPIYKQEYYELSNYETTLIKAKEIAERFNIKLKEIDLMENEYGFTYGREIDIEKCK